MALRPYGLGLRRVARGAAHLEAAADDALLDEVVHEARTACVGGAVGREGVVVQNVNLRTTAKRNTRRNGDSRGLGRWAESDPFPSRG